MNGNTSAVESPLFSDEWVPFWVPVLDATNISFPTSLEGLQFLMDPLSRGPSMYLILAMSQPRCIPAPASRQEGNQARICAEYRQLGWARARILNCSMPTLPNSEQLKPHLASGGKRWFPDGLNPQKSLSSLHLPSVQAGNSEVKQPYSYFESVPDSNSPPFPRVVTNLHSPQRYGDHLCQNHPTVTCLAEGLLKP